MNIQHNRNAASANRYLNMNEKEFQVSTQRLSSGYRINSAADDAAGLAISEKMRWQIRGMKRASDNIGDGISLTQVADGALQEVHDLLQRMVELTVQAANDSNTDEDRNALQKEINQIKTEINRISTDTEYNTIKIFKPTAVPKLEGAPKDMLVYYADFPDGSTRPGGIVYNGIRYAYEDAGLKYDANGNMPAGPHSMDVLAPDGSTVTIDLIFDGKNGGVPSGRTYELVPDQDGIRIDHVLHSWDNIRNENGDSIKESGNRGGVYSFQHAGMTVSFEVEDGADRETIIHSLKKDSLDDYELRSILAADTVPDVNPSLTWKPSPPDQIEVNPGNSQFFPQHSNSNHGKYEMRYDRTTNELFMVLPSSENPEHKEVEIGRWKLDDIGLPDSKWEAGSGLNTSSTLTNEIYKEYILKDATIYSEIAFAIDSEASKEQFLQAVQRWEIDVTMDCGEMTITNTAGGGTAGLTAKVDRYSPVLDMYGTQVELGLVGARPQTLKPTTVYDPATGNLSFEMLDGNQKTHTFTSNTSMDDLRKQIVDNFGLLSRCKNFARKIANSLNYGSSISNEIYNKTMRFSEGDYWMQLSAGEDITDWFTNDPTLFKKETDPDSGLVKVTFDESRLPELEKKVEELADRVVEAFKNTELEIQTGGEIKASIEIEKNTPIQNTNYSSISIPSDRQLRIQSSCNAWDHIPIRLCAMDAGILNVETVDVTSHAKASKSLDQIYGALDMVSEMRTSYGVTQNRLEAAMSVDDIVAENAQASESLLRDADMAKESVANAMQRILMQSGQSILAQANQAPQNILQLFS